MFKEYLQQKKYKSTTIKTYTNYEKKFLRDLQTLKTSIKELTYSDLLILIKYCRSKGNSSKTINHKLTIIRHYLDYKIFLQEIEENPAKNLIIKDTARYKYYEILTSEELTELFLNFPNTNKTNKIISGLIIFQALQIKELQQIKKQDFNLEKAKIFISGSSKKNSRTLKLESEQMFYLTEFLRTKKDLENIFEIKYFHNTMKIIKKQFHKHNEKVKNLKQIRASVITNWLKTNNLRQTQYMAGHKFVSSTEHYKQNNLENLQKEIKKYHPLEIN